MRIHHINCATMCPYGGRLINGNGALLSRAHIVCHCLLVETGDGLILVDTGLGASDLAAPKRLGGIFGAVARPRLDPEETAVRQIIRMGFKPDDVRHVVLTHLDVDHAGGLSDFPQAKVHVYEREFEAALHPSTFVERNRYIQAQWASHPHWVKHALAGEKWFGFDSVRALEPNSSDVLLVPLHGHSHGHCGVAVRGPERWLLHCGDAYFVQSEMDSQHPRCTLGLRLLQYMLQMDGDTRRRNQNRLRTLVREHRDQVDIFCAHDPDEFVRCRDVANKTE